MSTRAPVRSKVIAATLGAAVSSVCVFVAGLDPELGGRLDDIIEAAIVIVATFGAGYMKHERRAPLIETEIK